MHPVGPRAQGRAAALAAGIVLQLQSRTDRADLATHRETECATLPPIGETAADNCLDAAGTPAPRPCSHRIHVIRRCSLRCLGLADAVCCAEEGGSRSGAHIRALPLGFFIVVIVFMQELAWASLATTMLVLVFHAAPFHHCPWGRSGVAPLGARATVHLVGVWHQIAMRAGPMARALDGNCTASSSPTWTVAPTGPPGVAEEARIPPLPMVAPHLSGSPRTLILGDVTRLPARGVAGSACGPASAEASSQRGAGGGRKRRS